VCRSRDPRDTRLRPSVALDLGPGHTVLIDTSTDLRAQALTFGLDRVDAVLYTHAHADHVLGLDEVRRFNALQERPMPLHADARTLAELRRIFAYAFDPAPQAGGGVPQLAPTEITGPFRLGDVEVIPVPIRHGPNTILGYRVGSFGYLTDCSGIPASSLALLAGLDVLVLGALRDRPHPTHFSLGEALEAARTVGAARTFFTHMCHDLGHAATAARMPPGCALAFDGLTIEVS
jgi:phosphoribosyl 1,2-cyclic phosphate phosphodiesterase